MKNETDEDVVRRVQGGESEAFGELVERYQDKLLRYARKFLSDTDDAKDIVQDAFVKAYENIRSFDATRRFSPWIYRIAHNEFVNALKKRSHGPVFGIDMDAVFPHIAGTENAEDRALGRDLREGLERFLGKLDAKYREPLVLYYFQDMSYKDIAEVLRIPVSTVGVRIARGKSALQKITVREHII